MSKREQVLLSLISGFAVYLFDKVFGQQISWEQFREFSFLYYQFNLYAYQIVIFALVFVIAWLIIRKVRKPPDVIKPKLVGKSDIDLKKEELRKFNQKEIGDILYKWDVTFKPNGKPEILNLHPYCQRHGDPPLKMIRDHHNYEYRCPTPKCNIEIADDGSFSDFAKVKNIAESLVEAKWELLLK